ncbi:Serine/threonine-protein kinase UCNL [Dichanthelium oligosanthes]|uniref:non-specific serine/threonine protein kinase n=1 Tax=Dichanthelium oligosanthes TaxID=888268 RepID=A0A1E5V611_9POAL|nr:Serine/threonine-protein kinase UCNL [Dichanthelium oligosanthes]
MDIDLDRARALRVLGRGAMGTVFLVADGPSSASRPGRYALKAFDKRSTKPDADRRARWEISVLSRLTHPHLPSLLGFTETDDLLAWAVPYCSGGDLNELRYSLPERIFSPAAIRFYIAEIVSAIAELHAAGVVYRDLKPENVLLRADGHVVLTDFDLSRLLHHRPTSASASPPQPPPTAHRDHNRRARVAARSDSVVGHAKSKPPQPWSAAPSPRQQFQNLVRYLMGSEGAGMAKKSKSARVSPVSRKPGSFGSSGGAAGAWGKSYSFVGTEEYVAPEMVRGEGHGFAVDWWAVGVLVHEMAFGRTPFKGQNRKETFRNVLHRELEFPGDSRRRMPELTDLISRLLDRDPRRRLGYAGGADEIREHPFFAGVAWDMLTEVSRPPYIPPPADEDQAAGEGFDVREHFRNLHQPPPTKATSSEASSDFSSEF